MVEVINARDNEFAVATGSNVGSGVNQSTFDYPPTSTKNLVITSQDGDPTPLVFSVGDTYDVTFDGQSGQAVSNVTVIRSDPVSYNGDNGHAVVFEGTDGSGDTIQIVWSPDFDLEDWYFDNFSQGTPPGFYTTDGSQAEYSAAAPPPDDDFVCFAEGTRISVPMGQEIGQKQVQNLRVGDLVMTLDHGAQPLRWVGRRRVSARFAMAPVWFPAGAVGNDAPFALSQQHRVMVSSPWADLMFGQMEVLIPAKAFVGRDRVAFKPCERVTYFHLLFDHHEVVLAENAPCESLLLGTIACNAIHPPSDPATAETGALMPDVLQLAQYHGMQAARPVLHVHEARAVLDHVAAKAPQAPELVF